MTIPPTTFSGTNDNRLGIQVQFIYDATISGYRAITSQDVLSSSGISNVNLTVQPLPFRVSSNFTRPNDISGYAQYDAITNSTGTASVMLFNISGAAAGDFIEIKNVQLNINSKPTGTKLSANVFLSPINFSGTSDNKELSIDDTAAELGSWIPCTNQYQTALNYRCNSDALIELLSLSGSGVYGTLQAITAWNPNSGDRLTLNIEGYLYKS